MKSSEKTFSNEQAAALRKTRLCWAGVLLINAPLPFAALPLTGAGWLERKPDGEAGQAMALALVLGAVAVLAAMYARNQAYKAHWRGDVVTAAGYLRGNLAFFALLTAAAAGLFIVSVLTRYPAPTFAAAPVVIALLVFNFPTGGAMRPTPPRLGDDGGLR